MEDERILCRLGDLPEGGARGFLREGNDDRVFAVRRGAEVFVWLNDCPHDHRPLELLPDRFLSADGRHILCSAHAARFDPRTGRCLAGPCAGAALTPVPARTVDGLVLIGLALPRARAGAATSPETP